MAAIDAIVKILNPGDEIISTNDLYGGSYRLFKKIFEKYDLKFHFVDMENIEEVSKKINNKTKLIWAETPTNPMMNVVDIESISKIAKKIKYFFVLIILLHLHIYKDHLTRCRYCYALCYKIYCWS